MYPHGFGCPSFVQEGGGGGSPANGAAGGGAAILCLIGLCDSTVRNEWVDDPDAQREHDEYKERFEEPMPPGMDECERLKWRLRKEERLLRDRRAWDRKWLPGRHDQPGRRGGPSANQQSEELIKRLKKRIKEVCGDRCE